MAEYYAQRAGAGLIVTEATSISVQGHGWLNAPGIFDRAQQRGWRLVTSAVHKKGGKIFLQIWHVGGLVHPDFIGGERPVAPSRVCLDGTITTPSGEAKAFVVPRALSVVEIRGIVGDFSAAALHAIDAGFDGVEIHAANGFLIDQFTRDYTNRRKDEYGGSVRNRARFLLEVASGVADVIGADRMGVRLSPTNRVWGIHDSDPRATFPQVAGMLSKLEPAYLHVLESRAGTQHPTANGLPAAALIREAFEGTLILNAGYDYIAAGEVLNDGKADAIAFGVPFLANPDLVERFRVGAPLNEPDRTTFYTGGKKGYTDYPALTAATEVS